MAQADFMQDKRTQQAVVMSLIVLGEAATKVMDQPPAFAEQHNQIPWRNMRGMRNRISHGYFDSWRSARAGPLLLFGFPIFPGLASELVSMNHVQCLRVCARARPRVWHVCVP